MNEHVEVEQTRPPMRGKRRTTIMIDPFVHLKMQHIIIDLGTSFSEWVEEKAREEIAESEKRQLVEDAR